MIDAKKTGYFIKKKRAELHLSQQKLGAMLYVEPQTISKWERGLGMPDYSNLDKLTEIFSCRIEDILEPIIDENFALANIEETPEDKEESLTYYPIIANIFHGYEDDAKTDSASDTQNDKANNKDKKYKKIFSFFNFFSKKNMKKHISETFGYEYEEVYNEKFLFKNIFKKRSKKDYENVLVQGTSVESVPHEKLGITAPWLYMRALIFLFIATGLAFLVSGLTLNPILAILFSGLLSIVPLVLFLFESNFSRDMSLFTVIKIFVLGGLLSILFALVLAPFGSNSKAGPIAVAPICEEIVKFAIAVLFVSKIKPKNMLTGILIGFTIGAGFDLFESYMYSVSAFIERFGAYGNIEGAVGDSLIIILVRSLHSFLSGHHYFTGIVTGVYVLFKKKRKFNVRELFNAPTMLTLLFSIGLHAMWNTGAVINPDWLGLPLHIIVDVLSVATMIMLINIGIAQTKVMAIYEYTQANSGDENDNTAKTTSQDTFEGEAIIK